MNTNILYTLDKHHHPDPLTYHGYLFIRGSSDYEAVMGIYQFQLMSRNLLFIFLKAKDIGGKIHLCSPYRQNLPLSCHLRNTSGYYFRVYIYIYIKLHKHMKRHKNCMCKIITKEPISTDDISIAHARHTSFTALYKVPRRDMMLSTLPTRPLKQMWV